MKLLFVVNGHEYTAAHRAPLLGGARRAGYDVHCAAPAGSPALERLEHTDFPCHPIRLSRRGVNPAAEILALADLYALYRRLRPDIVHHATIKPVLYGSVAARRARVPAVVNAVTGLGYVYAAEGLRPRALRALVNPFYRLAFAHPNHRVIFQNENDWRVLERAGAARPGDAVLIPGSGVDTERFRPGPEPEGPPLILLPSRLLWEKGIGEFVEAARALKAEGQNARFVLVGDLDPGNPSAIPEEKLRAWEAEGAIEWWGPQDDMPAVYQRAHVVVLPSYYGEGLPKVLIEAAAAGKPVITADTPGCRDALLPGRTGHLVPPRDSRALADRIRELLREPQKRRELGARARELAEERFSTGTVVSATLAVYAELTSARGEGANPAKTRHSA